MTYDDAKRAYLEMSEQKHRPRTHQDYKRFLDSFAFGKTHLADITKHDIRKRLEKRKHSPTQYDQALRAVKTFFTWTVRQDYRMHSPVRRLASPRRLAHRARARFHRIELGTVLATSLSGPYPFGHIVALCILDRPASRRDREATNGNGSIAQSEPSRSPPQSRRTSESIRFRTEKWQSECLRLSRLIDTGQLLIPRRARSGTAHASNRLQRLEQSQTNVRRVA